MVPLHHGMPQVFQGGEPCCWASLFRFAVNVVVQLLVWRTSQILTRNISPQKMRDRKYLVFAPATKVGILAIFNIRCILTFLGGIC